MLISFPLFSESQDDFFPNSVVVITDFKTEQGLGLALDAVTFLVGALAFPLFSSFDRK